LRRSSFYEGGRRSRIVLTIDGFQTMKTVAVVEPIRARVRQPLMGATPSSLSWSGNCAPRNIPPGCVSGETCELRYGSSERGRNGLYDAQLGLTLLGAPAFSLDAMFSITATDCPQAGCMEPKNIGVKIAGNVS
jgi:hypothetical protein